MSELSRIIFIYQNQNMIIAKWKLKAIVQNIIALMPYKERVNYFFQKNVTKGVNLNDEYFEYKIGHARDHIDFFKVYGETNPDKTIIELGSGWYPIIPLIMFISDSGKVISLDVQSWMNKEHQITAINKIIDWHHQGKLQAYIKDINQNKWELLTQISENPERYTFESINEIIGLQLMLKDARKLDIKDSSVDLICSNNTFEHIYPDILKGILKEFQRVIKPDGVMSHFIDLSDHFAHYDKSINIYNFLKYSEKQWKIIDNSIQPQNRLRFRDYREIYHSLSIPISKEEIRSGNIEEVKSLNIHPEFSHYDIKDLAISHGYLVSKMSK